VDMGLNELESTTHIIHVLGRSSIFTAMNDDYYE
jgi:hypothetical protein